MRNASEHAGIPARLPLRESRKLPAERASESPRRPLRLVPAAGLALGILATVAAVAGPLPDRPGEAPPEASLAAAIRAIEEERPPTEALERTRVALAARPGWRLAERLRAIALLRASSWEGALTAHRTLLGEELAASLEEGTAETLAGVPPDLLFGMALSHDGLGDVRVAERLYRSYADAVGASSTEAARAYARLAGLLERSAVTWGDPAAERAKAEALDPGGAPATWLPPIPDCPDVPELAPYLVPIRIAASAEPESTVVRLPLLSRYRAPRVRSGEVGGEPVSLTLELHIDPLGVVESAEVLSGPENACALHVAAATAAMTWLFEPALTEDGPTPARIEYDLSLAVQDTSVASGPAEPDTGRAESPAAPDTTGTLPWEPAVTP